MTEVIISRLALLEMLKEVFLGRKKMTADGKLILYKRMKSSGNGKHVGKWRICFLFIFQIYLKGNCFKQSNNNVQ